MDSQYGGLLPVYAGTRIQRGGGILGSIVRFFKPTAKKLLTETVKAAPGVVDSIVNKKASVGSAILEGLKTAGKNTAQDALSRIGMNTRKRPAQNRRRPAKRQRQRGGGDDDIFSS